MICIPRSPPTYDAVQFNAEGDHLFVKRGYRKLSSNQLYESNALPRSPEFCFTWILSGPHNFEAVKLGDWIVDDLSNPSGAYTIYSKEEFSNIFMEKPDRELSGVRAP